MRDSQTLRKFLHFSLRRQFLLQLRHSASCALCVRRAAGTPRQPADAPRSHVSVKWPERRGVLRRTRRRAGAGRFSRSSPELQRADPSGFSGPTKTAARKVSNYGLHFRGNALLDDDADGIANEPYPADGTEMSKMLTTCDLAESEGCVRWTLTPCIADCPNSDANPIYQD